MTHSFKTETKNTPFYGLYGDRLHIRSKGLTDVIKLGNRALHDADATTDALLYTNRDRNDVDVFFDL